MNAKDLRIGNYVRLKKNVTIDENIVVVNVDNLGSYPLFNPIPLTEQWLIDFGFEKVVDGYFKKGIRITFREGVCVDFRHFHIFERVGYSVHQLQNLYHALTGKELTLNKDD